VQLPEGELMEVSGIALVLTKRDRLLTLQECLTIACLFLVFPERDSIQKVTGRRHWLDHRIVTKSQT